MRVDNVTVNRHGARMPIDPRVRIVTGTIQRYAVEIGGGTSGTLSAEQLVQLLAAAARDEACRKALVGLVYSSVKIADQLDADRQLADLEPTLRASLNTGART